MRRRDEEVETYGGVGRRRAAPGRIGHARSGRMPADGDCGSDLDSALTPARFLPKRLRSLAM